jgi:RNA polymerase sigma factor (sigma-70 family)
MNQVPSDFNTLVMVHLDLLYRLAIRMTRGNITLAEELVSDTYVRAFRDRGTFDPVQVGIRPWLVRIMNTSPVGRAERHLNGKLSAHRKVIESSELNEVLSKNEGIDFGAMDEEISRALASVPNNFQIVAMLWAEDFSSAEIGIALNLPIDTVSNYLHQTIGSVMQSLSQYAGSPNHY